MLELIPLSITTQALLLGATVGLITYQLFKKKYKLPPGPWAPPLIGNALSLRSPVPLYRLMADWKKKYGPIVTMYFGPVPCVVLNSTEVVNEALVKKGADFAGRTKLYSIQLLSDNYKDIVFADVSPQWKLLRKVAHQGLRQYLTGNRLEEKLFEAGNKVMKIMRNQEGKPVDMDKFVSLWVFNLLHGVCFNKSFELDDEMFLQILTSFNAVNAEFGNGLWEDVIPLLRYFPTKKFKRIIAGFNVFLSFITKEYQSHVKSFSVDNLRDFTDFMINAQHQEIAEDPDNETLLTDAHLTQSVSDIFSAGVDTTRQTIIWTIFLLVKHPDIQKKAQAEIDKVLDLNQPPSVRDRDQLVYTEAILHESMRLCPVAPLGVPHSTRCDTTLGEYEIPNKTMVLVNHWALHNDPEVWGDPEVFRPERLLDEDGKLAPKTMSWLPFSAGRRNCLGESIARPEMHLILALLLRNFSFSCPEGKELDLTPGGSLAFLPPKDELIATTRH